MFTTLETINLVVNLLETLILACIMYVVVTEDRRHIQCGTNDWKKRALKAEAEVKELIGLKVKNHLGDIAQ